MKRTRLLILALALTFLLPAFMGRAEEEKPLVVASVTKMNGNFTTNMWGNNTSDVDMRLLLHGLPLVYKDVRQEAHAINQSVVRAFSERGEADGGRTLTITLQPYLVYNDGSPINARDYVFSILMTASRYIGDIGGSPVVMHFLKGSAEYAEDPTIPFTGVRLLQHDTFELTFTPETAQEGSLLHYLNYQPYPYGIIAPGCDILDDGEGVYIAGPWSAELLKTTLLAPDSGYLTYPKKTSGPYSLVSFDKESGVAELAINRNYFGNPYGVKSTIARLRYEHVQNKDILAKLLAGEVDVVNKVSADEIIREAASQPELSAIDYPREGLAFLGFATERPLVSGEGVRRAIAYSLQVDQIVRDYLGERGKRVYGFYGSDIAGSPEWASLVNSIPRYDLNAEAAVKELEQEGFVYAANGELFSADSGGVRYRLSDFVKPGDSARPESAAPPASITDNPEQVAKLVPLSITIGITPENEAANQVVSQLEQNLPRIGAQLNVTILTMPSLLEHYYRQVERTCDLYFLGSNFMKDFAGNPSGYSPESFDLGNTPSALRDPVMAELTRRIRDAFTAGPAEYRAVWSEYQNHLASVLPVIPLYTNEYADLVAAASGLKDYHPESHWSWAEAIVYAGK